MAADQDTLSAILTQHLATYRKMSHSELATRLESPGDEDHLEVINGTAADGTTYTIETNILWDDRSKRHIRVISDLSTDTRDCLLGFIPIFSPNLIEDFIIAPDGRFIDE